MSLLTFLYFHYVEKLTIKCGKFQGQLFYRFPHFRTPVASPSLPHKSHSFSAPRIRHFHTRATPFQPPKSITSTQGLLLFSPQNPSLPHKGYSFSAPKIRHFHTRATPFQSHKVSHFDTLLLRKSVTSTRHGSHTNGFVLK